MEHDTITGNREGKTMKHIDEERYRPVKKTKKNLLRSGVLCLLCMTALPLVTGCFEYKLKVGYLAFHKKILLRNDPKALEKLEKGALRNAPSFNAGVRAYLEPGTVLDPLKYQSNWYYVKTPNNMQGWIFQSGVYRVPTVDPIYDLQYYSRDNHALIITVPVLIILLCSLFFFNNRFTRTILLPVLLILILITAMYFVGMYRARLDRATYKFKKISTYLIDKGATVYVTDYLWTNRLNFWTGYKRHFSYYRSSKVPGYNNTARIRTLRSGTDFASLRNVFVIADPQFYSLAERFWTLPAFLHSGSYPPNWQRVISSDEAILFWVR